MCSSQSQLYHVPVRTYFSWITRHQMCKLYHWQTAELVQQHHCCIMVSTVKIWDMPSLLWFIMQSTSSLTQGNAVTTGFATPNHIIMHTKSQLSWLWVWNPYAYAIGAQCVASEERDTTVCTTKAYSWAHCNILSLDRAYWQQGSGSRAALLLQKSWLAAPDWQAQMSMGIDCSAAYMCRPHHWSHYCFWQSLQLSTRLVA